MMFTYRPGGGRRLSGLTVLSWLSWSRWSRLGKSADTDCSVRALLSRARTVNVEASRQSSRHRPTS